MEQTYEVGQKLEVTVEKFTPLGAVVSFENDEGLAYREDIFDEIIVGEKYIAYVKEIREDGKIDITFRRHGYRNYIGSTTEMILEALKDNKGSLNLNDKSSPEAIRDMFGISKTQFKQAIGNLYKERKIVISETGISKK
jgi:uncharacterized protein